MKQCWRLLHLDSSYWHYKHLFWQRFDLPGTCITYPYVQISDFLFLVFQLWDYWFYFLWFKMSFSELNRQQHWSLYQNVQLRWWNELRLDLVWKSHQSRHRRGTILLFAGVFCFQLTPCLSLWLFEFLYGVQYRGISSYFF